MCKRSVRLSVYLADSSLLALAASLPDTEQRAHSWRYLQLLSKSASRLPALQLYTRLRLTPRATSAPGLAAPRRPCASPPARETRAAPRPHHVSSARLVGNNCRLVQIIVCKVWEAHQGTHTRLALASGGSFQPRLMPSARSARLSR